MTTLDEREAAATAEAYRMAAQAGVRLVTLPHEATPRQRLFLDLDVKEAFYGGAAGGGKSDALLMDMVKYRDVPKYSALIIRRTFKELIKADAIMDRAHQWFRGTAARWNAEKRNYTFPSGATLEFGHFEHLSDKWQYQSAQYQAIAFDELTEFQEEQYTFLFSRLRRLIGSDVPTRIRGASNPGGVGHEWVKKRFIPDDWTPEMALQMRVYWKESVDEEGRETRRPFVPARIQDNPYLDQADYISSLDELDSVTRAQLLSGDWTIRPRGDILGMWDENMHVIGWETHVAPLLGRPGIPLSWLLSVYEDQGQTEGHPTVTTWIAKAALNAPSQILPGSLFIYRGRCNFNLTVKQQADDTKRLMAADKEIERVRAWKHSHEAKTERIEYQRENYLPFQSWIPGKTRGIAQMRRYHEIVKERKTSSGELVPVMHPFKPGVVGSPRIFYCVADDELNYARTDAGLARHRAEAPSYKWKINSDGTTPAVAIPHDLFNDACLAAGTMISTDRGEVPIEQVTTNDLILTRRGYRRTDGAIETSRRATVYHVQWTQSDMYGTPNHPIWVKGRGFVPLASLKPGDELCPEASTHTSQAKARRLTSMVCAFIATLTVRATRPVTISSPITINDYGASAPYTLRHGRPLTDQFRKAMRFITRMVTASTMPSIIWNVSLAPNTWNDTKDNQPARSSVPTWPPFGIKQGNGTEVRQDIDGIAETLSRHGRTDSRQPIFASIHSVLSRFRARRIEHGIAQPVVSSAPRRIEGEQPVYNLTVEGDHEYYANGILTHNCDTIRMACADYGPPAALPTDAEVFEAKLSDAVKAPAPEEKDQAALSRIIWSDEHERQKAQGKAPQIPGRAIVSVPRGVRIRFR